MKAEIELHGVGQGSISLDGVDVSKRVRGGTLHFGVHETPLLVLDLGVHEGLNSKAEAVVVVTPETHNLLVRLGWKPPEPAPTAGADTALTSPG